MRVIFTGFTTKLRRTSSVFLLLRRVRSKTHLSCVSAPWFAWWQGAPGGQHIRWKKKKKNLFFKLPLFLLTAEAKKKRERGKKQCLLVAKQLGGEVRACSLLLPLEWTCFSSSVLSLIFPFFFSKSPLSPPVPALCSLYVLPENAVASGRASVVRPLPKPELLSQIARRSRASVGQRQRKGRPVGLQLDRRPPRGDFRRGLR